MGVLEKVDKSPQRISLPGSNDQSLAVAVAVFSAESDATAIKLAAVIIGIARKTAIDNGKRTLSTKRTDLGKSSGEPPE